MMNRTATGTAQPVMGFCYYCYFKACYFAGLFRRAVIPYLPDFSYPLSHVLKGGYVSDRAAFLIFVNRPRKRRFAL